LHNAVGKMSYVAIVLTRNGASTIGETLKSLLTQTRQPAHICVVNDGSSDRTGEILHGFRQQTPGRLTIVDLPDRGYDIRRVPANLNAAYAQIEAQEERFDYSLITGDDCVFPNGYCETLLNEMEMNRRLVIASGSSGGHASPDAAGFPEGAGRFVREDFWNRLGHRYPVAYGWEAWLVFKALQLGYHVECLQGLKYVHTRPRGSTHGFRFWGKAMRALGYHPLMALGRIAKNILYHGTPVPFSGSIMMLAAYLFPGRSESDPYQRDYEADLRHFVLRYQAMRIVRLVSRQTCHFSRRDGQFCRAAAQPSRNHLILAEH
jgi:glycosyltransferase involved in cell wall biosynthesis